MEQNRYNIEWEGQSFPALDATVFVDTRDQMDVTICDTSFENELLSHMNADDELADKAILQDEKIVYYIEPAEWELSNEEIVKIVEASYV